MKKQFNPSRNGACNLDREVKAGWKAFPAKDNLGPVLDMRVISTPNGHTYGPVGHVPCDHVLHVQYERGHYEFDGIHSKVTLA